MRIILSQILSPSYPILYAYSLLLFTQGSFSFFLVKNDKLCGLLYGKAQSKSLLSNHQSQDPLRLLKTHLQQAHVIYRFRQYKSLIFNF